MNTPEVYQLTDVEILLSTYHSERRQLLYRLNAVEAHINRLTEAKEKGGTKIKSLKVRALSVAAAPVAAQAINNAPSSTAPTAAPPPKKVFTPEPAVVRRKRKPSPWDVFVVSTLEGKGQPIIMSEFLEIIKSDFQEAKGWDEAKIKSKLNAVFHKLANKKGTIIKTGFQGRGFAYALPSWFNPAGELKKKHRR